MSESQEPANSQQDTIITATVAPTEKVDQKPRTERLPPYNVIILNDDFHSFEFVTELLIKLFKHDRTTAEVLTNRIDQTGRAIVFTTHKELAELKREQVHAFGPDIRNEKPLGPIGCEIEPAA